MLEGPPRSPAGTQDAAPPRAAPPPVVHQEASAPIDPGPGLHVLATVGYPPASGGSGTDGHPPGLAIRVPLPQLGDVPVMERWSAPDAPVVERRGEARVARTDDLLLGVVERAGERVEEDTLEAYGHMLALCRASGAHLQRVWNVIPRLHGTRDGLDRYMLFCRGRARAFERHHGAGFERHLCACSAVGSLEGPQVLWFLAARLRGEHLENPRQLSAYRYPARYGPRSPSFARATRAPRALGGHLWVSGTASIVGHESLHAGDVVRQTEETIRNLRALVLGRLDLPLRGRLEQVKVYLRRPDDLAVVRELVERELGASGHVLWLRADICRPELLVEIEGVAR